MQVTKTGYMEQEHTIGYKVYVVQRQLAFGWQLESYQTQGFNHRLL